MNKFAKDRENEAEENAKNGDEVNKLAKDRENEEEENAKNGNNDEAPPIEGWLTSGGGFYLGRAQFR